MSAPLEDIVKRLADEHGKEGAIERIMVNDWHIEAKSKAIALIDGPDIYKAFVEESELREGDLE
jgi:hypothetical protein